MECVCVQLKIVAFLSSSGGMNALTSLLQMIRNVYNVQTTGVVFPGLLKEIVSFHDCLHKPFVSHGGLILFGNLACGIHYCMILRKTLFQRIQQIIHIFFFKNTVLIHFVNKFTGMIHISMTVPPNDSTRP